MKIEILGTGCPKCKKLTEITKETVSELGIDEEIKAAGRIPSKDEIKKWINEKNES